MGEPIRVMVDLPNETEIAALFPYRSGRKLIVATAEGYGFVVEEDGVLAGTKNGKQVLNVRDPDRASFCTPVEGDRVALIGDNRRLLIISVEDLPEMPRGKGVRMQRFKTGGLSDLKVFKEEDGLQWTDPAGRTRTEKPIEDWIGKRGNAGRSPPRGFPKSNKFT